METQATKHAQTQFNVTIRTPAGHPGTFTVEPTEHVAKVVEKAVSYFAKRGELDHGAYNLVEVQNGAPTVLTDSSRLEDYNVTSQTDLHLSPKKAPVDG